jgi:hypothetical protein
MGANGMKRIERWNAVIAAFLILAAVVFTTGPMALGIAVGAILAVVNFTGIRLLVAVSLRRQGMQRAALQLALIAKMGVLFFLVFLAMKYLPISPVGLAIGLSVFLFSIAVESFRHMLSGDSDGKEAHDGRA